MEDELETIEPFEPSEPEKIEPFPSVKIKKWEHIAVKPETFVEFRKLKNTSRDNEFLLELLKAYKEKSGV